MTTISLKLVQPDYGFELTDADGQTMRMDSSPEHGGQHFGVRPMQTLLMALAGCSAIDVISILKKQRQYLSGMRIRVRGERQQDAVPALWQWVHLIFELDGPQQPKQTAQAISLSIEKYCSVAETLRRAGCSISWELTLNGETQVARG